ncbi:DUF3082 domain-containing protein [Vacuolonema iberomarrocanum]|uniref:DUF3082 domain-containing protein n=1 Tax=Vacuolonema iberomarrocanum TaxID=3454632 RepID=UPI0019FFF1BA|nr:DUF3082 domain-containing protein [filamentous cyanobacterium LEGE 07170]
MVNPKSAENLDVTPSDSDLAQNNSPTPIRCFLGAAISAGFAVALYFATISIHQTLADTPIPSGNAMSIRIASLVRTLVIGMAALGAFTFGITTLGLTGLGLQLLFPKSDSQPSE